MEQWPGLWVPMGVYRSWCLERSTACSLASPACWPESRRKRLHQIASCEHIGLSDRTPQKKKCEGLNCHARPCEANQSISHPFGPTSPLCIPLNNSYLGARMAWHQCPPTGCFSANAECYVSFLRLQSAGPSRGNLGSISMLCVQCHGSLIFSECTTCKDAGQLKLREVQPRLFKLGFVNHNS